MIKNKVHFALGIAVILCLQMITYVSLVSGNNSFEETAPTFINPSQTNIDTISENNIYETENNRWIVKFKDAPIFLYEKELDNEISKKGKKITEDELSELKEESDFKIKSQRDKIEAKHNRFLSDLPDIDSKISAKRIKEYKKIFNGMMIEASSKDIEKIKNFDYVDSVYKDEKVEASLYDSVPLINADNVWDVLDSNGKKITGQNVTIVIIDTGIDYTHTDFGSCTSVQFLAGSCVKVIDGYDFVNDDTNPIDDHGHGTHVAGIAAGNGTLKGVAPNAQLVAYKTLGSSGSGYTSDVILAIELASDPNEDSDSSDHYDIISMSLGASGTPDDAVSQSVDGAVDLGIVVIAAAGNSGPNYETISSPGNARKAITVGASDKSDVIASFSSRGPTSINTIKPDVLAPGVSICAAEWDSAWQAYQCVDTSHVAISGTSMATPHVAGIAALLKQKNSSWSPAEIKSALKVSAIDLGYDFKTQGWGRIDALAAVSLTETPCIAEFDTYNFSGTSGKILDIKATASCDNFSNYTLYYGIGFEPESWTLLNSSNIEANDELIYSLNTSTISDNDYTLRLVVNSGRNGSAEDRFFAEVDSIYINYPENNQVVMRGDVLQINGSSDYHDFINYTLSYGEGSNPSQWYTENITLTNNGSVAIDNGTLGVWNISMNLQGVYTIKLTVNYLGGEENSTVSVSSDDFMDGWGSDLHQHLNIRVESPVIDDMDGDGDMEVIVSTHENIYGETVNDCSIYVFYGNGTTYPGWPQTIGCIPGVTLTPAVGDIEKDGYKEIAVAQRGGTNVYLYQYNGTAYPSWPKTIGEDIEGYGSPVFADINNDNYLDILVNSGYYVSGGASTIYILNRNGTAVSGWPKDLSQGYSYLSNIAVADINNDGNIEVISSSYSSNYNNLSLDVFNSNGTYLSGFPIVINISATNWALPPRIADLDLDNDLEIIWATTQQIYVYHHNGTSYLNWPIAFTLATDSIISDINNDTFPEIIMPHTYANNNANNVLYIYHRNGSVLSGWPQGFDNSSIMDGLSVADIYGEDGKQEIIWADRDSKKTYGFHSNGSKIGGFPKVTNLLLAQQTVNALEDLDDDGGIEMVGGGYGLFVWDFSSNGTAYHEWNQHGGNARHDGYYRNKAKLPTSKNFNGKTTEFFYEKDISAVNNSVLEVRDLARVEFNSPINYTSLNLDGNINLSNRDIIVNETISGRFNKSANITLYNITLDNPVVFINNSECNSFTCTNISYNSSNDIFIFQINSFQTLMLKNVDIFSPDVNISSPSGTITLRSISVSFILDEIGYCEYSLNGGLKNNTLSTANSLTFTGTNSSIADGNYTINAYCNDSVGNRNDSVSKSFAINTSIAPIVTINSPSGTLISSSFTINITLNEEGYCEYSLNDGLKNNTLTNSNNVTFTGTNSSIADGSYTINAYCNDSYGNRNDTANKTFTISATTNSNVIGGTTGGSTGGGGGGGGSTPSDWTNTFIYDDADLSAKGAISRQLAIKERVKLSIDKEVHYVGVLSIANSVAMIQVSSIPQIVNLNVGSMQKFDVNDDGYYDLIVTLNSIQYGKANLNIVYIHELIPIIPVISPKANESAVSGNQSAGELSSTTEEYVKWGFLIILGSVFILIIIGVVLFLKKRRDNLMVNRGAFSYHGLN